MTSDEGRKAEAWWRLKERLAAGQLTISKAGHNDLSRWKAFGGTLDRPAPSAPMRPSHGPVMGFPMPAYCAVPVFVGLDLAADGFIPEIGGFATACFEGCQSIDCFVWGCAKGHGKPPRDMTRHPAPTAGRLEI